MQRGGHNIARPRPRHGVVGPRYGRARTRHVAQCARLGAGSRYNNCIVVERGATLCRDTVQPGLRYGAQCPTTRRMRMTLELGVSRYKLRHGRPGLRHDRPRATIRPGTGPQHGRDTAGLGAVRVACACRLGSGCVLGVLNPVLTQCTVLSHYLEHCS